MKTLTWRRATILGASLVVASLAPGIAGARAQEAPGEVDEDHPRARFAGGPLGESAEARAAAIRSVLVCTKLARTPKETCRERVGVKVGFAEPPPFPDLFEHTRAEVALTESLERGARAYSRRRLAGARQVMLYGIEREPLLQFQLKREMLELLGRVTAESRILRAATGIEPTSSIRSVAESQAIDRTRARATYIEIEGLKGDTPRGTTWAAQIAYAGVGASFFAGGLLGEKLLHGSMGDAFTIHPQPWPPGIRISGSFAAP